MKKILFLLGRYFPKASPNSICAQNVMNELSSRYDLHVVSYEDGLDIDTSVPVTKFCRGLIQSLLYRYEGKSDKRSKIIISALKLLKKIGQFSHLPIYPWTDLIPTWREWLSVKKLLRHDHFDMVISVYMPLSSLIIGHKIKGKSPDTVFCAWFLDSLSGGCYPNFLDTSYFEHCAQMWEKKLLKNADRIIFMESSKGYHESLYCNTSYEDRIIYSDLPVLVQQNHSLIEKKSDYTMFLYVGSLPTSIRSPRYILEVFEQIEDPSLQFVFIGDRNCKILNEYAAKDSRIKVLGRIPHDEVVQYEMRADVLVNIGNKNANLTPSKVFEYLSYGKPIISTYCIDDDTSKTYLDRYPLACCIDQRKIKVESSIKIENFLKENIGRSLPFEIIEKTYMNNSPKMYVKLIDDLFSK